MDKPLKTIYVNVKAELFDALAEEADRNGRSMKAQMERILKQRYSKKEAAK